MKAMKKFLNLMKPQVSFRGKKITIPLIEIFMIIIIAFSIRERWIELNKKFDKEFKEMTSPENHTRPSPDDLINIGKQKNKKENKQK